MSASALTCVALGAALGAAVQGVYGFGFALVAAPLLAAVLRPEEAIALLAVASVAVSGTVLATAPPSPRGTEAARAVLPWALLGAPAGCLLWLVPDDPLRVTVCIASLLAAVALLGERHSSGPVPWRAAGLVTGVLTTATGTNGPPLVLAFARAGLDPDATRRALAVCFLALAVPAFVLLASAGDAVPGVDALAAGTAGAAAGVVVALLVRGRVPEHRFRRDVLLLVAAASLVGLVAAVA